MTSPPNKKADRGAANRAVRDAAAKTSKKNVEGATSGLGYYVLLTSLIVLGAAIAVYVTMRNMDEGRQRAANVEAVTKGATTTTTVVTSQSPDTDTDGKWKWPWNTEELLDDVYKRIEGVAGSKHSDQGLGGQGTYGEITVPGVAQMHRFLALTPNDVFYDMGSGLGKVILHTALDTPASKVVGVELSEKRTNVAQRALKILQTVKDFGAASKVLRSKNVVFEAGDVTKYDAGDATVVFMCSLCFPQPVMNTLTRGFPSALRPGTMIVTIRPFMGCHAGLLRLGHVNLPQSWTEKIAFLIYIVSPNEFAFRNFGVPVGITAMNSDLQPPTSKLEKFLNGDFGSVGEELNKSVVSSVAHRMNLAFHSAAAHGKERPYSEMGPWTLDSRDLTQKWMELAENHSVAAGEPWPHEWLENWAWSTLRGNYETSVQCVLKDLIPKVSTRLPKEEDEKLGKEGKFSEISIHALQATTKLAFGDSVIHSSDRVWCECYDVGRTAALLHWLGAGAVMNSEVSHSRHQRVQELRETLSVNKDPSQALKMHGSLYDPSRPILLHLRDTNLSCASKLIDPAAPASAGPYSVVMSTSVFQSSSVLLRLANACSALPLGSLCLTTSFFPAGASRGLFQISQPSSAGALGVYMVAPRMNWASWAAALPPLPERDDDEDIIFGLGDEVRAERKAAETVLSEDGEREMMNITVSGIRFRIVRDQLSTLIGMRKNLRSNRAFDDGYEVPPKEWSTPMLNMSDIIAILEKFPFKNPPHAEKAAEAVPKRVFHALSMKKGDAPGSEERKTILLSFLQSWQFLLAGSISNSASSPVTSVLRAAFYDEFLNNRGKEEANEVWGFADPVLPKILGRLELTTNDVIWDVGAGRGRLCIHSALCTPVKKVIGITALAEYAEEGLERIGYLGEKPSTPVHFYKTLADAELSEKLSEATVILRLSNSTSGATYLQQVLGRLSSNTWVVTTEHLPSAASVEEVSLPDSWGSEGRGMERRTIFLNRIQ